MYLDIEGYTPLLVSPSSPFTFVFSVGYVVWCFFPSYFFYRTVVFLFYISVAGSLWTNLWKDPSRFFL